MSDLSPQAFPRRASRLDPAVHAPRRMSGSGPSGTPSQEWDAAVRKRTARSVSALAAGAGNSVDAHEFEPVASRGTGLVLAPRMDIARPSRAREKKIAPHPARRRRPSRWRCSSPSDCRDSSRRRPSVERATVLIDTVKRGRWCGEVRGIGTLVPEEIRWIPAATEARVERIVVLPGTPVKADTVILELSNPELELAGARRRVAAPRGRGQLAELRKVRLESLRLDQQSTVARVQAEAHQAKLQADADEQLAKEGPRGGPSAEEVAGPRPTSSRTARRIEQPAPRDQRRVDRGADRGPAGRGRPASGPGAAATEPDQALAGPRRPRRACCSSVPVEVGQRVTPGHQPGARRPARRAEGRRPRRGDAGHATSRSARRPPSTRATA